MSDSFFVDSNIFIYLFDKEETKKSIAKSLLSSNPIISIQVISENMNVLFKKFKEQLTLEQIETHKNLLLQNCTVTSVTVDIIDSAFQLKKNYLFQWYDSLIAAAALSQNCDVLYSEDLQHGLIIEKRLKIVNPFL